MYIRVTVTPGAKRESLEAVSGDALLISVKEPAQQNLANRRVQEMVAEHLGVPKGSVRMISGHHSTRKIFSLQDGTLS